MKRGISPVNPLEDKFLMASVVNLLNEFRPKNHSVAYAKQYIYLQGCDVWRNGHIAIATIEALP